MDGPQGGGLAPKLSSIASRVDALARARFTKDVNGESAISSPDAVIGELDSARTEGGTNIWQHGAALAWTSIVSGGPWTCDHGLGLHEDGERLVTIADRNKSVQCSILSTGGKSVWSAPCESVSSVAIGGSVVASGESNGTIHVWSLATGEALATLEGHREGVLALALHGDVLVSGSYDSDVRMWSVSERKATAVFTEHSETINSVRVGGSKAVSGSYDYTARVWPLGAPPPTRQALPPLIPNASRKVSTVAGEGSLAVMEHPAPVRSHED